MQIAAERLRQFVERIERLEEEKAGLSQDIRDVFAEAKSTGFDTKAMREVLKIRRKTREEQEELETLVDIYMHALEGREDEA